MRHEVRLGTKAESLARLSGVVSTARVLPLRYFDHRQWQASRDQVLSQILDQPWATGALIVRSSALNEDSASQSLAGRFRTMPGVRGRRALASAVDEVFRSYGHPRPGDQVLVQPELIGVRLSGVAFSCDPSTGAPYSVVNWSEGAATDAVTGGWATGLRTWCGVTYSDLVRPPDAIVPVLGLMSELRAVTATSRLDIEFAVSAGNELILLQVRPLVVGTDEVPEATHRILLGEVAESVSVALRGRADTIGRRTVFGVMPDWNPAEMIGLRPRPLALSLYKLLLTDQVWAAARHRYGYRDLRGTPLLVDFLGLPYVDVRASVTSLVPHDVEQSLAARLVDHWVDQLLAQPHLHDKLESRIVVSSMGLLSCARLDWLDPTDRAALTASLRRLTDRIVAGRLWQEDLVRLRLLDSQYATITGRLDWCVAHGSLPFAGLARAAFIATDLLDDLVTADILSTQDKERFIGGLNTVAGELRQDFSALEREAFLKRYGHLRPGTYDILSPRYDENPDRYFDWTARHEQAPARPPFEPTARQLAAIDRLIGQAGFSFNARRLMGFIGAAITGRERAKFEFTRVLSDVLVDIRRAGEHLDFSGADMPYADIGTVRWLTGDRGRDVSALRQAITLGRQRYRAGQLVSLPPLVATPQDVWGFQLSQARPNFVTRGRVLAPVANVDAGDDPDGAIALVASADPGYDWLFARGIAGLVTAFGGVNSHMAIRALELGIPAVIGAGEALFRYWSTASALDIDAANGLVAVVP